jgi:hypothetical protein
MQNKEQLADNVVEIVGIIAVEDKPAIIDILKRNGSLVTEMSTTDEIIEASLKSIKDNTRFRKDLKDYLVMAYKTNGDSVSNFSNAGGEGWKKVKNALGSVFSEENISQLAGVGIGYLGARMNANAQRGNNQQAIDFEKAKAQNSALELAKLEALSKLPQSSGSSQSSKKWIIPVAIGGGVLLIGTILFFVLRKK